MKYQILGLVGLLLITGVSFAENTPKVSFVNDVQPILTRAGCNQGACHGAQYGQGGLKLSLRGFDDSSDFRAQEPGPVRLYTEVPARPIRFGTAVRRR